MIGAGWQETADKILKKRTDDGADDAACEGHAKELDLQWAQQAKPSDADDRTGQVKRFE